MAVTKRGPFKHKKTLNRQQHDVLLEIVVTSNWLIWKTLILLQRCYSSVTKLHTIKLSLVRLIQSFKIIITKARKCFLLAWESISVDCWHHPKPFSVVSCHKAEHKFVEQNHNPVEMSTKVPVSRGMFYKIIMDTSLSQMSSIPRLQLNTWHQYMMFCIMICSTPYNLT